MIGVLDVSVQAKCPDFPLYPLRAYVNSPTSLRLRNVPRKIGDWQITGVQIQITYPDGTIKGANCVNCGNVWVGTVAGTATPGKSDFGYAVYASGIDEHGNPVTGYCLGKGDVEILDDQGEVTPSEHVTYTQLLSAEPAQPKDGNIWQVSGTYYIYQDGQAWPIGDDSGLISELSGIVYDLSAEVHGDYIVDSIGNAISANLSVTQIEHSDNWTVYFDNQRFELEGTKDYAQYGEMVVPAEEGAYYIELYYIEDETTRWVLYKAKYVNGDWTGDSKSVDAPEDVDSLSGEGWEARWGEPYGVQDKLVLESELENYYPKSELSTATEIENALSAKQDNLADEQISAINQVVDERTTVVDLVGGARLQFNVVGTVTAQMVQSWATVGQIEKIKLGTAVTGIGNHAFKDQVNLTTVEMPNVVTIGMKAFENCYKLKFPKVPDTLSIINANVFSMCSSITDVDIPASVYETGSGVFYGCTSLSAATIRTNRPGSEMFHNCANLSSVTIENAEFISYKMFYNCSQLTELEIPKSATIINSQAFANCPALTSVVFKDRLSSEIPTGAPWSAPNQNLKITTWYAASREWVDSAVKNPTITLSQGGVTKGSFTLNQSSNQTIDFDAGGGGGGGGYTVTVIPHMTEGDTAPAKVIIGGTDVDVDWAQITFTRLTIEGFPASLGSKSFYSQTYIAVPTNTGTVYVDGVARSDTLIELGADATVDLYLLQCIAGGTLVSLVNGTKKPIEEITYDDDLLVWNFDEGKLDYAKPTWIKRADYIFFHWETELASGKKICTCGQWGHRFFDLGTNTWVYASDIEGKTIYTVDGPDEVVSSKRIDGGKVYFYNIITKNHINLFCNDILTGCSLENKLYPVQDMKFVKDNRALHPYSEFQDSVPEYWYNDCRYAESTATKEYLVEYYNMRKALAV